MESKTKIALFCLIAISMISSGFAGDETCRPVTEIAPSVENENTCVTFINVDSKQKAKFRVCPKNQFCPFSQSAFDNLANSENVACSTGAQGDSKNFPGGYCNGNNDCILGLVCDKNICQGVNKDGKCTQHGECILGHACFKRPNENDKKCTPQKENGATCDEDYECLNTHGCFPADGQTSKTCQLYFSKANGATVGEDHKFGDLSPCASGKQDGNICVEQVLDTPDLVCKNEGECKYKVNGASATTITGNSGEICSCRYLPDPDKACYEGTNSTFAKNYVELARKAVGDLKSCHTAERRLFCNAYNAEVDHATFKTLTDLYFYRWMKDNSHRAKGLDEDQKKRLIKVVFTDYAIKMVDKNGGGEDYEKVVKSDGNNTCPIFKCNTNKTKNTNIPCVTVSKETNKTYEITLTESCDTLTQRCGDNNLKHFDFSKNILSDKQEIKCTNRTYDAYAGDSLDDNYKCHSSVKVDGKKCKPIDSKEKCTSSGQCDIGLYCNATSGACVKQLAKDEACATSYDCKNNLLCIDKRCQEMFSINTGSKFEMQKEEKDYFRYACKSGRVSTKSETTCVEWINKDENTTTIKTCKPGSACQFVEVLANNTHGDTFETVCECGFNSEGKAYCPAPSGASKFKF